MAKEIEELRKQLEQEKTLKEMYFTYYKAKHSDINGEFFKLKAEKEEIKKYLGISSKTIMERLEELQEFRDNDKDKLYQAEQKLMQIEEYCKDCNLKCDYTACAVLHIINEGEL